MNCPDGGVACERNLCGPQVEAVWVILRFRQVKERVGL